MSANASVSQVTDPYGLLARLDLNGDESIDFEEFRLLWCLIIGGTSVQARAPFSNA